MTRAQTTAAYLSSSRSCLGRRLQFCSFDNSLCSRMLRRAEKKRRKGSVLVLAMWTLFFLAALAMVVAARVSMRLRVAQTLRNRTLATLAAVSGVERLIYLACADTNEWDGPLEEWRLETEKDLEIREGEGTFIVSHVVWEEGGIVTNRGLGDEEGKINVNKADLALLAALCEAVGADRVAAREIAAAICDWRDPDDEPLLGGAESQYYLSRINPYAPHNGDMDCIEEMLLVKGVTHELFGKLEPFITVFGAGKVNINSADRTVLRSLAAACGGHPAACDSLAAKVTSFRRAGGRFCVPIPSDMRKVLKDYVALKPEEDELFGRMMGMVTLKSRYFFGTAQGKADGEADISRTIAFVIDREAAAPVRWHEN